VFLRGYGGGGGGVFALLTAAGGSGWRGYFVVGFSGVVEV
jgi:hypothetical protein